MKSNVVNKMYGHININFMLNPNNSNIMINATQIAKGFNKRIDVFIKSESTQEYIKALQKLPKDERLWEKSINKFSTVAENQSEFPPNGGNSGENETKNDDISSQFPPNGGNSDPKLLQYEDIYNTKGHQGTWMHRLLAIEFASWLDVNFKVWINITIDNILFGNYKKHWEAHTIQEENKIRMEELKQIIVTNPTKETGIEYFRCLEVIKNCGSTKRKAISDQYDFIHKLSFTEN